MLYSMATQLKVFSLHRQKEHLAHMNVPGYTHMRRGQILNRDWTSRWRFFVQVVVHTNTLLCFHKKKPKSREQSVCEKGEYVLINFWHF